MKHEKKNEWTHAICAGCWNARHQEEPEQQVKASKKMRGQAATPAEVCCFCGATAGGIYVHHDPADEKLRCAS